MTKLFHKAIPRLATLPSGRQDRAAKMALECASEDEAVILLTPEQIEGVRHALEQAERGEFADDARVTALLNEPWA